MSAAALLELRDYAAVQAGFAPARLWELFDGDRTRMNLAHECLDRHRGRGTAVSVQHADGRYEHLAYSDLADDSARFARWLARRGIAPGERVAFMLEPGRAFYTGLFGAIKRGAIAVPLFTLFGPEGLRLRIDDCRPRLLLVAPGAAATVGSFDGLAVVETDDRFWAEVAAESADFEPATAADSLCVFQYTSGTTRQLPEAVRHTQRSVVTLMIAALYGVGLVPGERYFCPSSPAWGHGLWHGTIAPLALGVHVGAVAGPFEPLRVFAALETLAIDNFAAAATVYRMLRQSGARERYDIHLARCSFTGEPLDGGTFDWVQQAFGVAPASMYGTTEVGVIMVDYPGFGGHRVRRGALGKPAPGNEVAILAPDGSCLGDGALGEIAVQRRGEWFRVKDMGWRDGDGYYFHAGRADDVIISAGWTMSAVEIENVLLEHPAVAEAAVVGVPDSLRGQIAKAYVVLKQGMSCEAEELAALVGQRLSKHEHPRAVAFVDSLPKTPAGKINRKALRDAARSAG